MRPHGRELCRLGGRAELCVSDASCGGSAGRCQRGTRPVPPKGAGTAETACPWPAGAGADGEPGDRAARGPGGWNEVQGPSTGDPTWLWGYGDGRPSDWAARAVGSGWSPQRAGPGPRVARGRGRPGHGADMATVSAVTPEAGSCRRGRLAGSSGDRADVPGAGAAGTVRPTMRAYGWVSPRGRCCVGPTAGSRSTP